MITDAYTEKYQKYLEEYLKTKSYIRNTIIQFKYLLTYDLKPVQETYEWNLNETIQ